ncbi:hypothetical protein JQC91_17000 [Jannaschia sp. Os4]|uniref:hypothetical protein n=1 Tax=Jannaschia sp. Os4 TaxID=2807617 RepID=UPI0019393151|nr:hypothetical protein [Jannaschia sp. Os4]MBM2578006.1 hypothetical protein [Jannaschia sp. Os4]
MIAREQLEAFRPLSENLSAFLRPDSVHPRAGGPGDPRATHPLAYPDGPEPDPHGFLSDGAVPEDEDFRILAVIDDVLPLTHRTLQAADGASRIASVWLQGARAAPSRDPDAPGRDLPFGRELRGPAIDALRHAHTHGGTLDEEAMLRAAGLVDPGRGALHCGGRRARHGAAVTDLLAGAEPGDPLARCPVIGVGLAPEVVRDTLGTFAPYYILAATLHVLHRARRLCRWIEARRGWEAGRLAPPVVVNLSFGLTAGPKDGYGLVERFQDAVAREADRPGADPADRLGPVRFILPVGNHRLARCRAALRPRETVTWRVAPGDRTPSFAEIWGPPRSALPERPMQVALRLPGGAEMRTAFTAHGQRTDLEAPDGTSLATAYLSRASVGGTVRETITLALPPTDGSVPTAGPGGHGITLHADAPADLYVQRDDSVRAYASGGRQSHLDDGAYAPTDPSGRPRAHDPGTPGPVRRSGTVNAFACGRHQVRVGAVTEAGAEVPYSALPEGAPDGRDHAAVAERGVARRGVVARGLYAASAEAASGTSFAAPQVARALVADGGTIGPAALVRPWRAHREW